MADKIGITIPKLPEFIKRMEQRAKDMQDAQEEATKKAVIHVHEKVPPYPGQSSQPYPFKSRKQYLFVVISIAEGSMSVPYRRTGLLGRSITTDVKHVGVQWVGTIGTATVYAPWVISNKAVGSRGPQAAYHSGAWYTLQGVVQDCREAIKKIYHNTILNKLNK